MLAGSENSKYRRGADLGNAAVDRFWESCIFCALLLENNPVIFVPVPVMAPGTVEVRVLLIPAEGDVMHW